MAEAARGGTEAFPSTIQGHEERRSHFGALTRRLEAEHDRWFLWLPVLFGAGVAAYFALSIEPGLLVALAPVVVVLAVRHAAASRHVARVAATAVLALALGFAAAKLRTEYTRAPVLQERMGPIEVYGFVELVEPRPAKGQRLTLRVTAMEKHEAGSWPQRVRVRTLTDSTLKPGDAVRVKAILNPPPGPALPGGYDFARTAWFAGLGAVGYTRDTVELRPDAGPPPLSLRIVSAVARVRQDIGRRVIEALPGQTGAIANGLITGERGGISEGTNQAFRDSGLFHILSISGLHMVIMAGAVFLSVRLLLAAIPSIALRYQIKKWAAAAAMLGALAYLLISGGAPATVRSYIMISIMFLAVLLDRPAIELRNVALAALVILVAWPESLLDPGFQMSFAAVVALVSVYEWLRRREESRGARTRRGILGNMALFVGGIVTSTLVAGFAVAPFGVYHVHNTQQFAILANLLAIPICNFIVMPAALGALVAMPLGLEGGPLGLMGWGIAAMVWCAETVAALPGAVGRLPSIPTYAFALIVCGGLWCALWSTRWRALGVVPIVLGLLLAPTLQRPDVLIGRGGDLIAVRGSDGRLAVLGGRRSRFELARWLEHDGDARDPAEASRGSAFRCDAHGCTAQVKGKLLAVAASPAALRDDCAKGGVIVLKFARPTGCGSQGSVVDGEDLRRLGAHALRVENGHVRTETVAGARGVRPWSPGAEAGATDEAAR
jgi:competence protein ComEC